MHPRLHFFFPNYFWFRKYCRTWFSETAVVCFGSLFPRSRRSDGQDFLYDPDTWKLLSILDYTCARVCTRPYHDRILRGGAVWVLLCVSPYSWFLTPRAIRTRDVKCGDLRIVRLAREATSVVSSLARSHAFKITLQFLPITVHLSAPFVCAIQLVPNQSRWSRMIPRTALKWIKHRCTSHRILYDIWIHIQCAVWLTMANLPEVHGESVMRDRKSKTVGRLLRWSSKLRAVAGTYMRLIYIKI